MPKSVTIAWKEYRQLLEAPVNAEARAVELEARVEELAHRRKLTEKDVTATGTYQKLFNEYAKVRDIVKVQRALEEKAAAAESKANAAARQLAAANEKAKELQDRITALGELLTEARYLASDYARRTRPNLPVPRWLTVHEVLKKKADAARNGRTWTVQGYTDDDLDF